MLAPFIAAIGSFFFYFLNPYFHEPDSYYFLNYVCGIYSDIDAPILSKAVFSVLPCEPLILKILLSLLFGVYLLVIYLLGERFYKAGKVSVLLSFLAPIVFFRFLKFEDDQLGYAVLAIAMLFFILGQKDKNEFKKWVSLGLVLLAALFWKGSIYYLWALGLSFPPATVLSVLSLFFFPDAIGGLLPILHVRESFPLLGLAFNLFLLGFGVLVNEKEFNRQKWFFICISILSSKWAFEPALFLAISATGFYKKCQPWLRNKMLLMAGFMLGVLILGSMSLFPNASVFNALEEAHTLAIEHEKPLKNEFGLGYYLEYLGIPAFAKGGCSPGNSCGDFTDSITVMRLELKHPEYCEILKESGGLKILDCGKLE